MNCRECGASNVSEAHFCLNCGAELPSCARSVGRAAQGARFFRHAASPPGPQAGLALPLPGPERKVITVLFADFAGFTEFVTNADAEDVHEAMGSIWARLDAIIAEHGGSVEKHMGHALMSFFGERQGGEDAPAQAVRAGLAIQARLQELRAQDQWPDLQLRIGIHTGMLVLEPRPAASEFRATGDALNLACRLKNPPGHGVLISHHLPDSVRPVRCRGDAAVTVKGISEPL